MVEVVAVTLIVGNALQMSSAIQMDMSALCCQVYRDSIHGLSSARLFSVSLSQPANVAKLIYRLFMLLVISYVELDEVQVLTDAIFTFAYLLI